MFSPSTGVFDKIGRPSNVSLVDPALSRGSEEPGQLNEGSDSGHNSDVEEQRRGAFEALSGYGSSGQASRAAQVPTAVETRQSRMIPGPAKQKSSMPPPSGSLGRPQSVRRAATVVGGGVGDRSSKILPPSAAAAAVSRSHLRNASTVSSTSKAPGRPLSRSNSTTPSTGRPPSASSVTNQGSQVRAGAARPGSSSGHSNSTREPTAPRHTRTASALPSLQARPQFNTYQQHYSPKKNFAPKPPTSSFLPSASATKHASSLTSSAESAQPSADIVRQQTELLQLHLLHAAATPCLASFERSAERKLRKRFNALAKRCDTVKQGERDARTANNVKALKEWGTASGAGGLTENLQVLGSVMREVAALTGSGNTNNEDKDSAGRFDVAILMFMRWIAWVEEVWGRRTIQSNGSADEDVDVLQPLEQSWFAEVGALERRAAMLLRELDSLDSPAPGSSVDNVLRSIKEQLVGMNEELRIARKIVDGIMGKEMKWLDERIMNLGLP